MREDIESDVQELRVRTASWKELVSNMRTTVNIFVWNAHS